MHHTPLSIFIEKLGKAMIEMVVIIL
jgi:hypothetical protein